MPRGRPRGASTAVHEHTSPPVTKTEASVVQTARQRGLQNPLAFAVPSSTSSTDDELSTSSNVTTPYASWRSKDSSVATSATTKRRVQQQAQTLTLHRIEEAMGQREMDKVVRDRAAKDRREDAARARKETEGRMRKDQEVARERATEEARRRKDEAARQREEAGAAGRARVELAQQARQRRRENLQHANVQQQQVAELRRTTSLPDQARADSERADPIASRTRASTAAAAARARKTAELAEQRKRMAAAGPSADTSLSSSINSHRRDKASASRRRRDEQARELRSETERARTRRDEVSSRVDATIREDEPIAQARTAHAVASSERKTREERLVAEQNREAKQRPTAVEQRVDDELLDSEPAGIYRQALAAEADWVRTSSARILSERNAKLYARLQNTPSRVDNDVTKPPKSPPPFLYGSPKSSPSRSARSARFIGRTQAEEEAELSALRELLEQRTSHTPPSASTSRIGGVATCSLMRGDDGSHQTIGEQHRQRAAEDDYFAEATNRPRWDSRPAYYMPTALRGLRPVTTEPWDRPDEVERFHSQYGPDGELLSPKVRSPKTRTQYRSPEDLSLGELNTPTLSSRVKRRQGRPPSERTVATVNAVQERNARKRAEIEAANQRRKAEAESRRRALAQGEVARKKAHAVAVRQRRGQGLEGGDGSVGGIAPREAQLGVVAVDGESDARAEELRTMLQQGMLMNRAEWAFLTQHQAVLDGEALRRQELVAGLRGRIAEGMLLTLAQTRIFEEELARQLEDEDKEDADFEAEDAQFEANTAGGVPAALDGFVLATQPNPMATMFRKFGLW